LACEQFKAVNTRDKNFTWARMGRRLAQIEEIVTRCLSQLEPQTCRAIGGACGEDGASEGEGWPSLLANCCA